MKIQFVIEKKNHLFKSFILLKELQKDEEIACSLIKILNQNLIPYRNYLEKLELKPDYSEIRIKNKTLLANFSELINKTEKMENIEKPDIVFLFVNCNSSLAAAITASKLNIKIAHLDAGLRSSFKNKKFKNINRKIIDHLSTILFPPTRTAFNNLVKEGLEKKSHLTGDLTYDTLIYYKNLLLENQETLTNTISLPDKFYLTYLNKPINITNDNRLKKIVQTLSELNLPVIFICPKKLTKKSIHLNLKNVIILDPLDYPTMISCIMKSEKVLTDSSNLLKEAYILKKPTITLFEETLYIETLHNNWNFVTDVDPQKIIFALNQNQKSRSQKRIFGRGSTAESIATKLKRS